MAHTISKSDMEGSVHYSEDFIFNSSGRKLFTCSWLPASKNVKALVFLCHGYGVECSLFMKGIGIRLAQAGFAVFGIDYEGHGKSDGLRCYIRRFSNLVDDCANHFKAIRERSEYKDKARFLFGESMGGAVALRIHRKQPNDWNGAVLIAPMCKISDEILPSPLMISILSKLCVVFPTWKIVPTQDIIDTGFKEPLKREEMRSNPYLYQDKPRLRSGLELMNASIDLQGRLNEVTLPFLVLHGEADVVTDIAVSRGLREEASSFDKEIITYPGMWHSLLFGEPDENIDVVMQDIMAWLDKRSTATNSPPQLPRHSHLSLIDNAGKEDLHPI